MMEDTFLNERYALVLMRIREIPKEIASVSDKTFPWERFFVTLAEWICDLDDFRVWKESHEWNEKSFEQ